MLTEIFRGLNLADPKDMLRLGSAAKPRNPKWPRVEKAHLLLHPACVVTKLSKKDGAQIEVHHVLPFHLYPEFELEEWNLRTVTREIHYLIGHCRNWSWCNLSFDIDAFNLKRVLAAPAKTRIEGRALEDTVSALKNHG